MNHFGAIVLAASLTGVKEIVLIGDINQLPYIERENLFVLKYHQPTSVATINKELLRTHRNPMDVAFALSEVYNGIYSAKRIIRSLQLKSFDLKQVSKNQAQTLFLVYTQAEKEALNIEGYGKGEDSLLATIHEAQGLTYRYVVILQSRATKLELHDSVTHAVVAISRHTQSCTYLTKTTDDAVARFIMRAAGANQNTIVDYNLKMAIKAGDEGGIGEIKIIHDTGDAGS